MLKNVNVLCEKLGINGDKFVQATMSGINLNEVESSVKFDGSLKAILDDVMSGKIQPTVDSCGYVTGFHYNSGLGTLEDNLAEREFMRAYGCKPVMDWVMLGLNIKASGLDVTRVVDEKYVVLLSELAVVDTNCNVVVKAEVDEVCRLGSREAICEYLVAKLNERRTPTPTGTITDTVTLTTSDVCHDLAELSDSEVLKNVRYKTGRCMAKGSTSEVKIERKDNEIVVSNIQWGRYLTDSERAELGNRL